MSAAAISASEGRSGHSWRATPQTATIEKALSSGLTSVSACASRPSARSAAFTGR